MRCLSAALVGMDSGCIVGGASSSANPQERGPDLRPGKQSRVASSTPDGNAIPTEATESENVDDYSAVAGNREAINSENVVPSGPAGEYKSLGQYHPMAVPMRGELSILR